MKILNEITLSSFWKRQQDSSFGIITAFRGEYTYDINRQLNRELKNDLLSRGLYIAAVLDGIYKENFRTEEEREVKEQAYLVFPKIGNDNTQIGLKKILVKLGEKYNQDSILFKSVYEDEAILVGTSKREDSFPSYHQNYTLGKFLPKHIGEFYSRMRGKAFTFNNIEDDTVYQDSSYNKKELQGLRKFHYDTQDIKTGVYIPDTVFESLKLYSPKSIDRIKDMDICTFINEEVDIEYTPQGYKHVMSPVEKVRYSNQPKFSAYWLYSNRIIPVPTLHIDTIINHPDKFGYTEDDLREIYFKHGEPYGHEGKARVEIVTTLIDKGWMRVRYTPRNDLWTIELNRLNRYTKDSIWTFFTLLTGNDIGNTKAIDTMNQFSDVRINEIQNGTTSASHKTSVREVIAFAGLFEGCKNSNSELVMIENLFISNFEKTLLLLLK